MRDVTVMLQEFSEITANPKAQLDAVVSSGKKAVGCIPYFYPEELVTACRHGALRTVGRGDGGLQSPYLLTRRLLLSCSRLCWSKDGWGSLDQLSAVISPCPATV